MSIFTKLIMFSHYLETEEDYTIWILALYKLCKENVQEHKELELIQDVVTCAIDTAERTGTYINYFSKTLAATMQQIEVKQ